MIDKSVFTNEKFHHVNLFFMGALAERHCIVVDLIKEAREEKNQFSHVIELEYKDGTLFVFNVELLACFYCITHQRNEDLQEITGEDEEYNEGDMVDAG